MSDRLLHQSTPGFHGDKCRLRYGETGAVTYFDLTDGAEREVATVYLPENQKSSLREACAAFNRIMDEAEGAVSHEVFVCKKCGDDFAVSEATVEGDEASCPFCGSADLKFDEREEDSQDDEPDSNRTLGLVTIQGGGRGWGT